MDKIEIEKYLHEHRAWNWVWPDEKNCWATGQTKRKGPSEPYHGPSKKAVARRNRKKNQ